jgi:hypothetical protein
MDANQELQPVVKKKGLHDSDSDFAFWQSQTMQQRLAALEQIRQEFHQWRYGAQPRLQRVYSILKRK